MQCYIRKAKTYRPGIQKLEVGLASLSTISIGSFAIISDLCPNRQFANLEDLISGDGQQGIFP